MAKSNTDKSNSLNNYKAIGATLKAHRLRKNVRQDELADATGLTRQTIANIENGKVAKTHHLCDIANYLGIKIVLIKED